MKLEFGLAGLHGMKNSNSTKEDIAVKLNRQRKRDPTERPPNKNKTT